jgi:hypothetical protein
MAFKMRGFSPFDQKKETDPKKSSESTESTRDASQDPHETTANPNDPRVTAMLEEAKLDQRRKDEEARLRSKRNPNPHSPHTYYYGDNPDDWREETQISDNPDDWGWENEPEYVTKYTVVHGGHETEKVINPWGPLATSDKPEFGKDYLFESELRSGGGTWRDRAYLEHEGKK